MNTDPATTEVSGGEPPRAGRLRGRRLFFARRAWILIAALSAGLFVASVPFAYARFRTPCEGAGCDPLLLTREGARTLKEMGLSTDFYAAYMVALAVAFALGFWAIGALLFWKRSDDRLVFYASVALLTFGATQPDTLRWLAEAHPAWELPGALVGFVGDASFFVLFCIFPDGRFVPRWTRWAAAAWVAYGLLDSIFPASPIGPRSWPALIDLPIFMGLICSLVVAQVQRYRRVSTREQRQQTKWVVFGFAASITIFVGVVLFHTSAPLSIPTVLYDLVGDAFITIAALLVPLSIAIAILRHRLWDIDLVISRSLIYGTLSALLASVYVISDTVVLPFLVRIVLGESDPSLNAVVSALIVVLLFEPLRSRIKALVERLADRLAGGHGASESPG